MNLDARGHFQVGTDASDERSLFVQFAVCPRGDAIEHISDVKHVKVESRRRDP
jgi:hypothetical protein